MSSIFLLDFDKSTFLWCLSLAMCYSRFVIRFSSINLRQKGQ